MPVRVFHGDDSAAFRLLIREVLPNEAVAVVGSGATVEEVLSGVAETRPDVLLLDQMCGPEVVDAARALVRPLRVVLLSGFAPGDGNRELEARADAHVVKSADIDQLRAVIVG